MTDAATLAISRHAGERWAQRFPGADLAAALARAERVTFLRLRQWATGRGMFLRLSVHHEYAHDAVTGSLFLIATNTGTRTLVTVLPLRKPAKTRRLRTGRREPDPGSEDAYDRD